MIIWVRGITGSGKSYLCKKLDKSHVQCFDTDDYVTLAYESLKNKKTFIAQLKVSDPRRVGAIPIPTIKKVTALAKKMLEADIKACKKPIRVVVGITVDIKKPDKAFFICMNDRDLRAAYKRTIKREISKIRSKRTQEEIDRVPVHQLGACMHFKHHINALHVDTSFAGYKQMYENDLKLETKKKQMHIATQSTIIKIINALAKNIHKL